MWGVCVVRGGGGSSRYVDTLSSRYVDLLHARYFKDICDESRPVLFPGAFMIIYGFHVVKLKM